MTIMGVCPRCGLVGGTHAEERCPNCKIPFVMTDVTWDKYCYEMTDEEGEKWKSEAYDKYCKDSPYYKKDHSKEEAERKAFDLKVDREAAQEARGPKCPTCGSRNVSSISGLERGVSVAAWGIFSKKINKSFKCRNCGYTW